MAPVSQVRLEEGEYEGIAAAYSWKEDLHNLPHSTGMGKVIRGQLLQQTINGNSRFDECRFFHKVIFTRSIQLLQSEA